eukprot:gb/GECG01003694.1/.p1 GENE.gb/GECG01003694.1/~~gb/GECG01003694.1/.p1  ORF type:complete len:138 (+),score=11.84 gb/GECG01003694.1/:1-414(+)
MKLYTVTAFAVLAFAIQFVHADLKHVCSCTCAATHESTSFRVKECTLCPGDCLQEYPNCGGGGVKDYCYDPGWVRRADEGASSGNSGPFQEGNKEVSAEVSEFCCCHCDAEEKCRSIRSGEDCENMCSGVVFPNCSY